MVAGLGHPAVDWGSSLRARVTATTVISQTTHQLIASHRIDPDHNYWRNQQKRPGRLPGRSVTDDATHM
ncbi:MAG: hypothetical protein QOF88_7957 [Mycobacterium sp.]|jgi:hypothetical protein|nr:hypothetical protein [Mycobacterium sp.]MDT5293068.1 hypothetical protein [Mycobacterium sp.]